MYPTPITCPYPGPSCYPPTPITCAYPGLSCGATVTPFPLQTLVPTLARITGFSAEWNGVRWGLLEWLVIALFLALIALVVIALKNKAKKYTSL